MSIYGETPLSAALESPFQEQKEDLATIYRYALEDPKIACSFIPRIWYPILNRECHTDSTLWLYQQSTNILPHEDSCVVRACVIWDTWLRMLAPDSALHLVEYLSFNLDAETLDVLRCGCSFIPQMFRVCFSSHDSFVLGNKLLEWISNSGINVGQLISHEVELANKLDEWPVTPRRFIFEPQKEGGWKLGFEYVFDREASGYLLVSEYEAIMVVPDWGLRWPIYESINVWEIVYKEWRIKQDARFQRRMAAKARKQSGHKRCKKTMPGAWVH